MEKNGPPPNEMLFELEGQRTDGNFSAAGPFNRSGNGTMPLDQVPLAFSRVDEYFGFLLPQVVSFGVIALILNLLLIGMYLPQFKKLVATLHSFYILNGMAMKGS